MKIHRVCATLLLVGLSACYRITYRVGDGTDKTYTVREWNQFFLQGLAPVEESRNLETLCPGSKILEVKTFTSPANVLSGALYLGMTSGTSIQYTCTFPEDRLARSAGKIRDSLLSQLGLDGEPRGSRRRERDRDEDEE
jgi:hypothetical protein